MTRMPLWLAAGAACAAALPFVVVRPRPAAGPDPAVERAADTNAVTARSMAKLYLAREVAQGRRTVPEAAAVYGWLNRQPPATPAAEARHRFPGLSAGAGEADVLCAQVVSFVAGTTRLIDPYREPDLVRVAQQEVDAARGPDGRPVLPAVSEADCEELLRRATIATAERQRGDSADLDWIGEGLALVGR